MFGFFLLPPGLLPDSFVEEHAPGSNNAPACGGGPGTLAKKTPRALVKPPAPVAGMHSGHGLLRRRENLPMVFSFLGLLNITLLFTFYTTREKEKTFPN